MYMNLYNVHNLIEESLVLLNECQMHEQNQKKVMPFKLMIRLGLTNSYLIFFLWFHHASHNHNGDRHIQWLTFYFVSNSVF